jgi:hypothetical protein
MIKELDRVLGVLGVAAFQYYDDPRRRMLYGRAGEYRTPKYGFEYRVLSSAWTIHPGIAQFVYEVAREVVGGVLHLTKDEPLPWWNASEDEVRRCINNCDVALARELIERNRHALIGMLLVFPRTSGSITAEQANRLIDGPIMNGFHTALRNPDQYSAGWHLDGDLGRMGYSRQWSGAASLWAKTKYFD